MRRRFAGNFARLKIEQGFLRVLASHCRAPVRLIGIGWFSLERDDDQSSRVLVG